MRLYDGSCTPITDLSGVSFTWTAEDPSIVTVATDAGMPATTASLTGLRAGSTVVHVVARDKATGAVLATTSMRGDHHRLIGHPPPGRSPAAGCRGPRGTVGKLSPCLAPSLPESARSMPTSEPPAVVIVGAGPAGLTAAYQLVKQDVAPVVLEADSVVGGISRTAQADGWRFDIGGHRFFTKVEPVEALWHEILADDEFLVRPRMSRIYYQGKFYDYPIRPMNALRNLGVVEASRCVASYLWARVHPPADQTHPRGLHRRQLRLAPLPPLLQDLQRDGLGRAGGRALGRLRRAADQGHVAVPGRLGAGAGPPVRCPAQQVRRRSPA